jgi:TRAP-type mannitol/chloroaromatic compound transport system substrate-binding protein
LIRFTKTKEGKVTKKLLILLALIAAVAMIATPAMAKKTTIKCQQCYSSKLPGLGTAMVWMANMVKEASDEQMKIKIYEPGKLVKCFEVLDAVSRGQIDAGFAGAGFWAGKLPAAPIFSSIPFGPEATEYLAWMYYGGGLKLAQEMYDKAGYNVVVLPSSILVPETSGWFTKPIKSLDDLKGMKMRFYGLGGQAMQKLGMSITLMPAGELFPALEKKVIDATEFSMPSIDRKLGFYKLAKYNYFPGWHQQATIIDFLINKKKWNKLGKAKQAFLKMAAMASMTNSLAELEAEQGRIIKENEEKLGVKSMYWSPEMLDAFKAKWQEVAAEQSAKDPMFKKVLDNLQAFRAEYKYWGSKGFLPRNCK